VTPDVHENLVFVYETGNAKADKITRIVKGAVCCLGLDLNDCKGYAYDGGSVIKWGSII